MTLPRSSAVGVQTRTRPDVRLKANLRRERGNATPLPLRARGRPGPRIQMQRVPWQRHGPDQRLWSAGPRHSTLAVILIPGAWRRDPPCHGIGLCCVWTRHGRCQPGPCPDGSARRVRLPALIQQ